MKSACLVCLVVSLSGAPIAAQGITGPSKPTKEGVATSRDAVAHLRTWAVDLDRVPTEGALIARLHRPLKAFARDGSDEAWLRALKPALRGAEERARTVLRTASSGRMTASEALDQIRLAVEEYTVTLEDSLDRHGASPPLVERE